MKVNEKEIENVSIIPTRSPQQRYAAASSDESSTRQTTPSSFAQIIPTIRSYQTWNTIKANQPPPHQPSTFEHYTSRFLVNKRWQTEALTAFFSSSDLDLTRRNRLLNFISSHASSSVFRIIDPLNTTTTTNLTLTLRNPLPGLLHLISIRLLLSEILLPGVLESLSQTCPELSKLEIHAEARDFEGEDFEPSNLDPDARNISTTDSTLPISAKAADAAALASLLSISPSTTPSTTRRNAPIWKLRHTVPSLHSTNFYALIRDNLQGKLREATLMLSQKSPYWEGKTVGEESAFASNLWKLRWVLLDCCVVVASGVAAGGGEGAGQRGWIEGETGEGMEVEETEIEKMEVEEGEIEEGEIEEEEIEEGEIEEMEVEEGEIVEIEGGEADRAVVGREAGINRRVRRSRRSRRMNAEIARL